GIGRVTDPDSCSVCCSRESGTAFMAFVLFIALKRRARRPPGFATRCGAFEFVATDESPRRGRSGGAGIRGYPGGAAAHLARHSAKLPYAGITRIRFEGSVSTGRWPVPPLRAAFDHATALPASGRGCTGDRPARDG